MTMSNSSRNVGIIDDNPTNRERYSDFVRSKSFEPIAFEGQLDSIDSLIAQAKEYNITYALCDHRLFEQGDYAAFYGSEAVATFYKTHEIAPVLITGYEDEDSESTIREFRKDIPVLMHSSDVSPKQLERAMIQSYKESIEGIIPPEREACPAIMTVTAVFGELVKVEICQWNTGIEVGFPISLIPSQIQSKLKSGCTLRGEVNVDAEKPEDLFFKNLKLAHPEDAKFSLS